LPVPLHRGHLTFANARFTAEKRRIAINVTISALFFMRYSPSSNLLKERDLAL
jgi:hypothetical protein